MENDWGGTRYKTLVSMYTCTYVCIHTQTYTYRYIHVHTIKIKCIFSKGIIIIFLFCFVSFFEIGLYCLLCSPCWLNISPAPSSQRPSSLYLLSEWRNPCAITPAWDYSFTLETHSIVWRPVREWSLVQDCQAGAGSWVRGTVRADKPRVSEAFKSLWGQTFGHPEWAPG